MFTQHENIQTHQSLTLPIQLMQFLWDIYSRDKNVWMKTALEILADISDVIDTKFLTPKKEKDSRWLTNGRAAENILKGYYIVDEEGTPFWVLLAISSHLHLQRLRLESEALEGLLSVDVHA